MRGRSLAIAGVMIATVLAGCASSSDEIPDASGATDLVYDVTGPYSVTLAQGIYEILDPISVFVDIALPVSEGGAAIDPTEPPVAHLGLFMPDIAGCDFSKASADGSPGMISGVAKSSVAASEAPDCKVPVIADAGPYYGESDVAADMRGSGRLGEFLITNFVPQGYAVAQISVLGSGKSNHCFDMFGDAEQLGVVQAIEWLGSQDWSNGNVGLIGRSYDGSTPWMAAAHAPDALKTIVPISGLSGLQDLVTWNGASEARILTFHNVIYGQFGVGGDDVASDVRHRATCPDWLTAAGWGGAGYASGDDIAEGSYWEERNFVPEALQNYEGSVYMIHGLLDSNVDPHAGWVAHQKMSEKGLDTKGLYGQWQHNYPDRLSEHGLNGAGEVIEPASSIRYDWAQDLLEWFDFYLQETGPQPDLVIEVQQQDGRWRVDDKLQPSTAEIMEVALHGPPFEVSPASGIQIINLGVLSETEETILAGLTEVDLHVLPTGPGGQIHVELYDITDGRTFGLSYGISELRHAPNRAGEPVVPGVPIAVTIPFQYFSASLEAGHVLGLRISNSGNGFLPSPVVEPVQVHPDMSALRLSTLAPAEDAFFEVPAWVGLQEQA